MRMTAKKTSSKMIMTTKIDNPCDHPTIGGWPSWGWCAIIMWILVVHPGDTRWLSWWWWWPSVDFWYHTWDGVDHPGDGGWPSLGWSLTILGIIGDYLGDGWHSGYVCWASRGRLGTILGMKDKCSCDHPGDDRCLSRGWWSTILGKVGDHPQDCGWPTLGAWVTVLRMVGDRPWDGGGPSWRWWVTILGWLMAVLWKDGYHILDGGWPCLEFWVTNHGICHLGLNLWFKSKCKILSL